MAEIAEGDVAPGFELPGSGGSTIRLADHLGKAVVISVYPQDGSASGTAEAADFSRLADRFAEAGAVVIGVSPDSAKSHDKFAAKHGLRVALAADESRETIEAYGLWVEKSMYGRAYMGVERATFLVGPDGRVARVWRAVRVKGHAEEVLAAAAAI